MAVRSVGVAGLSGHGVGGKTPRSWELGVGSVGRAGRPKGRWVGAEKKYSFAE